MIIWKREMKTTRKGLIIWTICLGVLCILMMSMYPTLAREKESIDSLLQAYPEELLKAFNMKELDFGTILGYYAMEGYLSITLFGSIYAAMLGGNILSKEKNEKTIEFLLSKPVTRREILVQKWSSIMTNLLIFNGILTLINWILFETFKQEPLDKRAFILISIAPLLMHLTYASISFLISTLVEKSRTIVSISLGIVLVTFFLNIVGQISKKLEMLKYFSPFEYTNPSDIILRHTIKAPYLAIMVIVIMVCIISAYIIYENKDITV